jgi:ribosomal protein S18 acetylase RimI-like enzyme
MTQGGDGPRNVLDEADGIRLRRFEAADEAAYVRLQRESPDTGDVAVSAEYPGVGVTQEFADIGHPFDVVVAETDGRLVGAGAVNHVPVRHGGEVRSGAHLMGLVVHPDYRRQGIATRLARARVELARERDDDPLVFTSIQPGNVGSLAVAESWGGTRAGRIERVPLPVTERTPTDAYEVRDARAEDADAFVAGANRFYDEYDFAEPATAERVTAPQGANRPVVAVHGGEVVAGATPFEMFRSLHLRIRDPSEGERVLKLVSVTDLWHDPDHPEAANALLDWLRTDYRSRATNLSVGADAESPLWDALSLPETEPMEMELMASEGRIGRFCGVFN